jgi:hypothetical protein
MLTPLSAIRAARLNLAEPLRFLDRRDRRSYLVPVHASEDQVYELASRMGVRLPVHTRNGGR